MISPILLLSAIAGVVFMCLFAILLLGALQYTDEPHAPLFTKVVIVSAVTLAQTVVMCLPFDIAISHYGDVHRDNMFIVWESLAVLAALHLFILLPLGIHYYELDELPNDGSLSPSNSAPVKGRVSQCGSHLCRAIWRMFHLSAGLVVMLLIVGLSLFALYVFFGSGHLPVMKYTEALERASLFSSYSAIPLTCSPPHQCQGNPSTVTYTATFPVFVLSVVNAIAWAVFVVCGGWGLGALPIELFNKFRFRPRGLSQATFTRQRRRLNERANQLEQMAQRMEAEGRHRSATKRNRRIWAAFQHNVVLLELDWKNLEACYKPSDSRLVAFLCVPLGILSLALSAAWLIHVIIFKIVPESDQQPFLNEILVSLDSTTASAPLGTVVYGILALYLVLATMLGILRLERAVPLIDFPLSPHSTMLSALAFHAALLLLSAMAVVQFAAALLALFSHDAAIEQLVLQVENLELVREWLAAQYPLYGLIGIAALGLVCSVLFPTKWDRATRQEYKQVDEDFAEQFF